METIQSFLEKEGCEDLCHATTLARTLDRWGFEFGKGVRTQNLKEKNYVIAARKRYLRRKISNRLSDKDLAGKMPEVYLLDESYIKKNHSNDFTWYSSVDGPWLGKPTGKGERLIIINAITIDGWVPNAKLVFKSSRKTGDYHGQMNYELFSKWFKEYLIPNIPKNSLIIMDNAAYHNKLSLCSAPISNSSKADIRSWLEGNKIPVSEDCLKAELVELLNRFAPSPTYAIDEIAREYGHEILRTPQYHIQSCNQLKYAGELRKIMWQGIATSK